MRALKHIGGILLATVGALFVLSAIVNIFNRDPELPLWGLGVMFVICGLVPLGGAFALLRRTVSVPSRPCPKCGSLDRQPAGILRRSFNPWIFHLGGWLFSALWGASREEQVRCTQCDMLYLIDTKATRIAGVLLWVLILVVLSGLIAERLQKAQ